MLSDAFDLRCAAGWVRLCHATECAASLSLWFRRSLWEVPDARGQSKKVSCLLILPFLRRLPGLTEACQARTPASAPTSWIWPSVRVPAASLPVTQRWERQNGEASKPVHAITLES